MEDEEWIDRGEPAPPEAMPAKVARSFDPATTVDGES
jgi:hypothetical protein